MLNNDQPTKTAEVVVDPMIGQILGGRYELLERIGDGGMGTIYRAKHRATDAAVAIKLIHRTLIADMKAVARFQQEAKILGSLQHQNIIGVKAIDADSGLCFIVMEFAHGNSLAKAIRANGPLNSEEFEQVFKQAASGLAYAHERGVIHRDIKPSNLMLVPTANGQTTLKILDFGVSKLIGASDQMTTESGICLASPHYMSPEQCDGGTADKRSDIYSLGCVMFEALAGRPPFEGRNPIEIVDKHLTQPIPDFGGKELRPAMRVIAKCMAKDPAERYQSMEEVLQALAEGETRSVKLQALPGQPKKRSMVPLVSLSVIAVVAMSAMAFLLLNRNFSNDGELAMSQFGALTPGLVVTQFCEALQTGTPSEAAVKEMQRVAERPDDEILRRLANNALAMYYDKVGDKNNRDRYFQEALDLSHRTQESASLSAETWAAFLNRDHEQEKARLVLENELEYAKKHSCFGDAMDLEGAIQALDAGKLNEPQLQLH